MFIDLTSWVDRNKQLIALGATIASVVWMGLIFFFSSLSGELTTRQLDSGSVSWLGDWRSYAAHIVLYAILAALLQISVWGWGQGQHIRTVLYVAIFSTIYAITDEFHQSFVDGRSATIADTIVDSISATAAATFFWFILPKKYAVECTELSLDSRD